MKPNAICPHCGEDLVEDECYDTCFERDFITKDFIVNYIAGHCPTCEKEFQWVEVYEFAGADEIEEVI